jgi:hypothetical protein
MILGLFKYIAIYVKVSVIRKRMTKHRKYKNEALVIVNGDHLIYGDNLLHIEHSLRKARYEANARGKSRN